MTDNTGESRRSRITIALVAAAIVLNLGDVVVTLSAWSVESNPIVTALGPTAWVAVKAGLLAALPAAACLGREHRYAPVVAGAGCVVGLVAVVGNLSTMGWVASTPAQLGAGSVVLATLVAGLLVVRPDPSAPEGSRAAALASLIIIASIAPVIAPVANGKTATTDEINNYIYTADSGASFTQVNKTTLATKTSSASTGHIAIGPRSGYVANYDTISVVNRSTLTVEHSYTVPSSLQSITYHNATGDVVFGRTSPDEVSRLNPETGTVVNTTSYQISGKPQEIDTGPDGYIYVSAGSEILKYDKTLSLVATFSSLDQNGRSLDVTRQGVYVGTAAGTVYNLSHSLGEQGTWSTDSRGVRSIDATDDKIWAGQADGYIRVLDSSLSLLYERDINGGGTYATVEGLYVSQSHVFAGTGTLYKLERNDLSEVATTSTASAEIIGPREASIPPTGSSGSEVFGTVKSGTSPVVFTLEDYTGEFSDDPTLTVSEYNGVDFTAPSGSGKAVATTDWSEHETADFNYANNATVRLENDTWYKYRVRDGDAVYSRIGDRANASESPKVITIGEPTPTGTATATNVTGDGPCSLVESDDGSLSVACDWSAAVSDYDFNISGPNGETVYDGDLDFDEPVDWYRGNLSGPAVDNVTEEPGDVELNWSGTYDNGTEFNGTDTLSTGGFTFGGGPMGGDGSGPSGTQRIIGFGLIAGTAALFYQRFGDGNLASLARRAGSVASRAGSAAVSAGSAVASRLPFGGDS